MSQNFKLRQTYVRMREFTILIQYIFSSHHSITFALISRMIGFNHMKLSLLLFSPVAKSLSSNATKYFVKGSI